MKTAIEFLREKEILAEGFTKWQVKFSDEKQFDIVELMKEFAKMKCKEQQELAKEHLYDVGQTVYLTEKNEMPYPNL